MILPRNKVELLHAATERLPTNVQGFRRGKQDLSAWGKEPCGQVAYTGVCLVLLKEPRAAPLVSRQHFILLGPAPCGVSTLRLLAGLGRAGR